MTSGVKLQTYTAKERNMYLVGLAGQNIIYNIIGAALAYYLQFTLLIPAIAVSTIMAIARVWDAFNDPMMGTIVDKTRTKWGKCRPYLMFIPLPLFLATMACFINGFFDPSMAMFQGKNAFVVLWAAFSYILWGMVYTVGDIPLWGITPLMTEVEADRTRLLSLARIVASVGAGVTLLAIQPLSLAIGQKLAPVAGSEAKGERLGFVIGALIFAVIGTATFQMAGLFTKERIKPSAKTNSMGQNFKLMLSNKPYRQIFISGLLAAPKQLLLLCAMPLVTYYYASKDPMQALLYMVLLGGGMFLGQFIGMGFVPVILKKFSKKTTYNASNLITIIPFVSVFLLFKSAPTQLTAPIYLVICFLLFFIGGAFFGITMVLQSLMIADAVDYEDYHNHLRPDGVFFSGQSFMTKLGAGLSTFISGIAYTVVGFSDAKVAEVNNFISSGGIPRDNPEYMPYLSVLFFLVSIPPAIGCLLSVIPTWKYCLSDKEHQEMLEELNRRRSEEKENAVVENDVNENDS